MSRQESRAKWWMPYAGISCVCVCLGLMLGSWWWIPKRSEIDQWFYGHYRGLGLVERPGFLGKSYFRIETVVSFPEDGWCNIDCAGTSQPYPFVAHYPDGTIRAKGRCNLSLDNYGQPSGPWEITDGSFFDPKGTQVSEMRDGIGVETFYKFDGTKVWEASLRNFKRVKLTTWHRNGQLQAVFHYREGNKHGPVDVYAPDGSLKYTIVYEHGCETKRIMPEVEGVTEGADRH